MKRQLYPWDKWFKKRKLLLTRGKDFKCQPHGMAQQIRNEASRRGVSLKLSVDGNQLTIERR